MVRNMKILSFLMALGCFVSVQPGICAELDAASDEALARTQAMLRDPSQRDKATAATKQAQFVDQQTQSLAGTPENKNAIYDLSADIMESLVQKTNGDPEKMKALLDQAKNDPKAFADKLTPEQQKKLQEISRKIPIGNASNQAKP